MFKFLHQTKKESCPLSYHNKVTTIYALANVCTIIKEGTTRKTMHLRFKSQANKLGRIMRILLVFLILLPAFCCSLTKVPVKIEKGIHCKLLEHQTFYHAATPLVYEIEIPKLELQTQNLVNTNSSYSRAFYELIQNGTKILTNFLPGDY